MRRDAWHLRANAVVVGYFVAAGLVAALARSDTWVVAHLLLLGGVTNAIVVWGSHFAVALLVPDPRPGHRAEGWRLVALNGAVLAVIGGELTGQPGVVVVGAACVAVVVTLHAAAMLRLLRRARNRRWVLLIVAYAVASGYLVLGVVIGTILALEPGEQAERRLLVAHLAANLLGWIGVTVAGTVVQLWPTIVRRQLAPGTEQAARIGLPWLSIGPLIVVLGALLGWSAGLGIGLAVFVLGWGVLAWPHLRHAADRPPAGFAAWSVAASIGWLVAGSVAVLVLIASVRLPDDAGQPATVVLGLGFAVQIVVGALAFLGPAVLGGGPAAVRAAIRWFEAAGWSRLAAANVGLVCWLLAPNDVLGMAGLALTAIGLASSVPLAGAGVVANRRMRRRPVGERVGEDGFTARYHP